MLMNAIGWILFGLAVGVIARALLPGRQGLGLLMTTFLGIAGSFLGGALTSLLVGGSFLQASGWIGSIVGALLILAYSVHQSRLDQPI